MQGELFRAHAHIRPRRANFFAHKAQQHSDIETTNTTARPQQGSLETGITSAPENRAKNTDFAPAKVMAVSIPHRYQRAKVTAVSPPPQAQAHKGNSGFRQPAQLAYRVCLRYPWAAADPGRATGGRPTLQTSSNQHDLNHLARTSVTNVVNLSRKISVFNEKAVELTTFVTTTQDSAQNAARTDDVCNNA